MTADKVALGRQQRGRRLLRRTARVIHDSLTGRRYRLTAAGAAVVYLLVFLAAIRDLTVSPGGLRRFADPPAVEVVPDWTSRMFDQLAPFHFEPVAAVYPTGWLEILISPLNIATGLALGGLVGLNIAVAWHVVAQARTCRAPGVGRTRAFGGLIGALPSFFVGMACCAPALTVALGAQFTVLLTAVRSWFVPVVVLILVAVLLWNVHRAERLSPGDDSPTALG
ncbi:MAG: hypothetical protein ACRDWI_04125 [Jiangellaceae bacterium]